MSVSQTQFDPDLTKETTDIQTLIGLVNQFIAALNAANAPDDLTTEDNTVKATDASVLQAIAAAQAALTPAPSSTTPPAAA